MQETWQRKWKKLGKICIRKADFVCAGQRKTTVHTGAESFSSLRCCKRERADKFLPESFWSSGKVLQCKGQIYYEIHLNNTKNIKVSASLRLNYKDQTVLMQFRERICVSGSENTTQTTHYDESADIFHVKGDGAYGNHCALKRSS
jgi:hypothetical protein